MKILKEHPVDFTIVGSPRWWTVEIGGRQWECVRMDYEHISLEFGIFYVLLPPGLYEFPTLVSEVINSAAATTKTIEEFQEKVTEEIHEKGAILVTAKDPSGRILEIQLMGRRR